MKYRLLLVSGLVLGLTGCATEEWVRGYVQQELKPVHGRLDALEGRAGTADAGIKSAAAGLEAVNKRLNGVEGTLSSVQSTLKDHDDRLAQVSKTAQEALDRATAAGKLAEGKLVYESVLTDDTFKFNSGHAVLSAAAKTALKRFADDLKRDNKNVFIEIQGHTDSTGPEVLNERLGLQRAEAVRRYLALAGGIPLHRMSAISYGESEPVADNKTRAGRKDNRRVVLVVLR